MQGILQQGEYQPNRLPWPIHASGLIEGLSLVLWPENHRSCSSSISPCVEVIAARPLLWHVPC